MRSRSGLACKWELNVPNTADFPHRTIFDRFGQKWFDVFMSQVSSASQPVATVPSTLAATTPSAAAPFSAPKRGRGRPTIMDQEAVSRTVLDLWDQHGYANVGWQDIADATGVSVRTLTRHFPSKSAIAWVGAIGATDTLAKALLNTNARVELNEAIYQAIVRSVEFSGYGSSSPPSWIKAAALEPELVATAKSAF